MGGVAVFHKLVQDLGLGYPTRKDSNLEDNVEIGCHLLAICSVAGRVLSTLPAHPLIPLVVPTSGVL